MNERAIQQVSKLYLENDTRKNPPPTHPIPQRKRNDRLRYTPRYSLHSFELCTIHESIISIDFGSLNSILLYVSMNIYINSNSYIDSSTHSVGVLLKGWSESKRER